MTSLATLRVLWAALMGSVGLFAALIFLLPPAQVPPDQMMFFVLAAVAASTAAMSFVVPKAVHAQAVKTRAPAIGEVGDPNAPAGFGDVKRVRMFQDPAAARRQAYFLYQQYTILGCALSEAVAMFGLVLNRMGHPLPTVLGFIATSLVLMALRYPSEAKAVALFESAAQARLS